MAASITTGAAAGRADEVWGRRRVHLLTVQFDTSYPTGGEVLSLAAQGVKDVTKVKVFFSQTNIACGAFVFVYDHTNDKLMVFRQKNPADAGGADIALVEVANAVDLSSLIVDLLIIEA